MGYFFDGIRRTAGSATVEGKPLNAEKRFKIMEATLGAMLEEAKSASLDVPFVIVDDCSPTSFPADRFEELLRDRPFAYVRLLENKGAGGKENVLQRVLGVRCQYVLRCDDDVLLNRFRYEEIAQGFEELKDAWAITSCITLYARMDAASLPESQRYFRSGSIADFVAMRSSVFGAVGYSDPALRSNEDGDLRLRCLAVIGASCYVDRRLTGKAMPSGAGASLGVSGYEQKLKMGRYVEETRPFIKVVYPKGKTPRFTLNKKYMRETAEAGAKPVFYVPPSSEAEECVQLLWGEGGG